MKSYLGYIFLLLICFIQIGCGFTAVKPKPANLANEPIDDNIIFANKTKVIHLFVALCDNKYQGIVPVPASIGNGQIPATNLYWGCAYGVKSYFKKSANWQLLQSTVLNDTIMERVVFKHKKTGAILVADAYNGQWIKSCTVDFLKSCSGERKDAILVGKDSIGILGNATMVAYIGHDGLMDFRLTEKFSNVDGLSRDAVVLACYSKNYFANYFKNAKANPILWSTGRMAPEAYVLHDGLEAYLNGANNAEVKDKAAAAYSKFQKCSKSAASKLIVTN